MSLKIKLGTFLILFTLLGGISSSIAQTVASKIMISQASEQKFSSTELEQFAELIAKLYTIDQQTTEQIVSIIEKEGMSVDRFNAIVKWKKDPQQTPNPSVSDAEMESFKKSVTKIAQLQEQADTKIKEVFQSQGLQVERFNQILEAVREDPNLQNQVQQILEN